MPPLPYEPKKQLTLADVFSQQGGTAGPAPDNQAPGMSPGEQSVLDAYDDQWTGEASEPKKKNYLASILMGAGDAMSAYASVLGSAPEVRTNNLQDYMEYLQRQNFASEQNNKSMAEGKAKRDLHRAEFLVTKEQRDLEVKAAGVAEKKAEQLSQEKITREANAEVSRRAFEMAKVAEDHRMDREEQDSRFKHETGMAKLEASLKTGANPKDEKALQSFSLGSRIANGIVRGMPESKENGAAIPPLSARLRGDKENNIAPETPEELRREYEDEMTQEGIFGPARDLSRDYFNERLIRAYRESQQAPQSKNPGQ